MSQFYLLRSSNKTQLLNTGSGFSIRTGTTQAPAGDSLWSNVTLLMHLDSNISDVSSTARFNSSVGTGDVQNAWFTNSGTTISGAQAKFGAGSLFFDSSAGTYCGYFNNTDPVIGTGDYTLEFWAWPKTMGWNYGNGGIAIDLWQPGWKSGRGSRLMLGMRTDDNAIRVFHDDGGYQQTSGSNVFTPEAWNHIAICRASGTRRTFVNGNHVLTSANDSNDHQSKGVILGTGWDAVNNGTMGKFNGYLDEIRLTHAARYTSSFTPPASAFLGY